MIISTSPITVSSYKYYYSNSFVIPIDTKNSSYVVTNENEDVFLREETGVILEGDIYPKKNLVASIVIRPNAQTATKNFKIILTAENDSVEITGSIIVPGIIKSVPSVSVSSTAKYSYNGNSINIQLNQNDSTTAAVRISSSDISWVDGNVTDFSIVSSVGADCASDVYIARSATSLSCTSSSGELLLSIILSNPNATKSVDDQYGFVKENKFKVSFVKEAIIQGETYLLSFTINIEFKHRQITIEDRRCQTAMIDQFHQKIIIAYDFDTNVDVMERQIMIGTSSLANIPSRFSYDVPDATMVPGITGRYKLPMSIIAQSCAKGPHHYTMKLVLLSFLPKGRKLVSQRLSIPMTLSVRGYKHYFNIPVEING